MTILTLAKINEHKECYRILDDARNFQREQGFIQWDEKYPTLDMVEQDIINKKGYVVKVDEQIAGYMCIEFDGEPAYLNIRGTWRSEKQYAVVHRMGLGRGYIGVGLTAEVFALIEKLCEEKGVDYIRVDTDFPNKRMQHILEKNGYVYCGIIDFQGEKLAYDKVL